MGSGAAFHFTPGSAAPGVSINWRSTLPAAARTPKATNGKKLRPEHQPMPSGTSRILPFNPRFLNLLAQNYGAGLNLLDFKNSPEPSRVTINNWVSDQTNNRIKDLLPQGSITPATRFVLTNAIYFDAAWQKSFY